MQRVRGRVGESRVPMGSSVSLAVCTAMVIGSAAQAQDFFVSSGRPGGYYHAIAGRLVTVLDQEGVNVQRIESEGSLQNLARLRDPASPVNVALAQADALRKFLDDHPDFTDQMLPIDNVGRECVILITRKKGGIASAADLKQQQGQPLSIADPESGQAVTFELMKQLEPAFANTSVVYQDPLEALLLLRLPNAPNPIAALMLVQRPRSPSPELEIVISHPDEYRIAPVRPGDLETSLLPDQQPVYTFEEVTSGFGRDQKVSYETMCTRGLMLASKSKLSASQRHRLAEVMLKSGRLIAPGRGR